MIETWNPKATTLRNIIKNGNAPDILTCIANLSSDEVFTPPELADKILDLLPKEVWSNKDLRWLDPACKTGIFLRQIAKRLMEGLREEFPDEEMRRQHIFKNMLYGIGITNLTALMSRRSLYTSKNADGEKSIARFENSDGNISYDNRPHIYKNGSCIHCGNKEGGELDRDETLERHAYNFIHLTPEEARNMKFDVIVGNPPYQLGSGGHGAQATPIYNFFIEQALRLKPHYIAFIIPSRWFAGGMGLKDFRNMMLNDRHIRMLYDYPNADDCFPGVSIEGGVMYYIWDSEYEGDCEVHTISGNGELAVMKRSLAAYDVFVRYNQAVQILEKVKNRHEETVDGIVSGVNPFNFATNFRNFDQINNSDKIKIYANKATGYIQRTLAQTHREWIDKYKVLVSEAYGGAGKKPWQVLGRPIIAEPGSVCTFTYVVVGVFETEQEAKNYAQYITTRFFRFMVSLRKNTQHASGKVYSFVPLLSFKEEWTDEKLYKRYGISQSEIDFIETMVKEMN
ncbi:MAG: Eco57I restriction-modification methylase domain-containing protein [Candidatus Saccharibacteria bacterium]|nr:Eco57I restriction-modification methylase domain-containing protein [Candidatus Saccharibacteria bacterium]